MRTFPAQVGLNLGSLDDVPPDTPTITDVIDGGNGVSAIISITGTYTVRLYYRFLYADTWTTGGTRSGSGDVTQSGLSSGRTYEFYCVADDGVLTSIPSNIMTQRISGTTAKDIALGRSVISILTAYIINNLSLMTDPSDGNDWPLYISSMPDGDNVKTSCGAIYDTAGVLDGKLSSGEVVLHPGIHLRIRSNDYEEGYAKIEEVALALDNVNKDTIVLGGDTYLLQNISRTTSIVPLGPEKGYKRRFLFTVNFLVSLRKV